MFDRLKPYWERYWGWLLIVGALAGGGLYYDDVRDQEARSHCQTIANKAFADNIVRRSTISVASDKAQSTLLLGVAELLGKPEASNTSEERERAAQFLILFSNFRDDSGEVDKLRASNPYPDLSSLC